MSIQRKTRSFLGVPVTGDITEAEKRAPQRPLEELAPLMQAVIDDPEIVKFSWQQYTPYFNDGEPCTFSAYAPAFFTVADRQAYRDKQLAEYPNFDPRTGEKREELTDEDLGMEYWTDELDDDDYEINGWRGHPTIGSIESQWDYSNGGRTLNPRAGEFTGPDRARYDRCYALAKAIDGGAFDDVLMAQFGDHAEITFERGDDGSVTAHVESYSHD